MRRLSIKNTTNKIASSRVCLQMKEHGWWKQPHETWSEFNAMILSATFKGGLFSAIAWCIFWLFGYTFFIFLSDSKGNDINTTAYLLTIAVMIGHLPGIAGMLFNTDGNFRNIWFKLDGIRKQIQLRNTWYHFKKFVNQILDWLSKIEIIRILIVILLVYFLVINISKNENNTTFSNEKINIFELDKFIDVSIDNLIFCIILFMIQFTLSFPDKLLRVKKERQID